MAKKKIIKVEPKPVQAEKHIFKSKTFWVNIITIALIPMLPQQIKPYLEQPEVIAGLLTAINVVMRLVSKDKVYLF